MKVISELKEAVDENATMAKTIYEITSELARAWSKQFAMLQIENKQARKTQEAKAEARNLKTELTGANKTILSERENAKQTLLSWKTTAQGFKTDAKKAMDAHDTLKKQYDTIFAEHNKMKLEYVDVVADKRIIENSLDTANKEISRLEAQLKKYEDIDYSSFKQETKRNADLKDKEANVAPKDNQGTTQMERAARGTGYRSSSAHGLPKMSPGGRVSIHFNHHNKTAPPITYRLFLTEA